MADKQDGAWFWSKTLTGLGVLVTGLALWGGLSPSGQPDCNGRKMQPGDTCVSSGGQRARSYDEAVADAAGTEQLARTGIVVGPMLLIGGVACLVAFRSCRPSYRW